MLEIQSRIVADGHGYLNPCEFAVHCTDNYDDGADAAAHARYWAGDGAPNAVHLVVDDTVCYQCVPYDRKCWQVGNANYRVEGIEICCTHDHDKFIKIWANAVDVVSQRLQAHGWGVDQMHSHKYYSETYGGSDHTDPDDYFEMHGKSWADFVAAVRAALNDGVTDNIADSDDNFHGGNYECTVDVLNVRSAPTVYSDVVATYGLGQIVELDDWYTIADGYVWGRYTAYSGNVRYIAIGRATGKPEPDDYLVRC